MQWPNDKAKPVTHCPKCNVAGYRTSQAGARPVYKCFQCGELFGSGVPQKPKEKPSEA